MLVSITNAAPFAYITNFGSSNVSVIDTATNQVTATVNVGVQPDGVAVTPDGKKVYVGNNNDGTVSVIDTSTNTVTATVTVGTNPNGIVVSPDGTKVYVACYSTNNIFVIDTATNTVTATVNAPNIYNPTSIAITPDGTKIYVGNNNGPQIVSVIDTTTYTVITTVGVGANPHYIAITPNGAYAYVTSWLYNNVYVINTTTNAVIATIPVGTHAQGAAVSPDGAKVYVTNSGDKTISIIDAATNIVTATIPVGNSPNGVEVSPDGSKVYVANTDDGTVSVIDTTTKTVIATVSVGTNPFALGLFIGPATTPAFPPSSVQDHYSFKIGSINLTVGSGGTSQRFAPPANMYLQPGHPYDLYATVYNNGLCNGTLNTSIFGNTFTSGVQVAMYIEPLGLNPSNNPQHTNGPSTGDILLNADGSTSLYSGSFTYTDATIFNNPQYWTNVTQLLPTNGVVVANDTYAFHYLINIQSTALQAQNDAFNGTYYLLEAPNP